MNSSTIINRPFIPKFNPGSALRSPLDMDDLTNQWKKIKPGSDSSFGLAVSVQRHERLISKLRRRIVTPPVGQSAPQPVSSASQLAPFQIYAVKTVVSGQPNYSNWFQIRGGYVGYRSAWPNILYNNQIWEGPEQVGNYESTFYVAGTDRLDGYQSPPLANSAPPFVKKFDNGQTDNTGGVTTVTLGVPVAIGTGSQSGSLDSNTQIKMDLNLSTPEYARAMSVWIEITDATAAGEVPFGQMWAQCFTRDNSGNCTPNPFPAPSPKIIPIGIVWPATPYYLITGDQLLAAGKPIWYPSMIQNGNAVNRYPYSPSDIFSSPVTYRGAFSADSLNGQRFYPGDVVLDDVNQITIPIASSTTVLKFYNYFICQAVNTLSGAPIAGTDWRTYTTTEITT